MKNAFLDGNELPNTPVNEKGPDATPNGWVCLDGNVLVCPVCGSPLTTQDLDDQAISLESIENFDSIEHSSHPWGE